ncbi:ABC transporter ATP-binding protein [Methylobacterium symbioticum]|uniref:ABC transporter ATP-binding protein n=1 Tax=uncultured Methylobacterium sp. TaxID=157278 RepID=UPI0025993677|nr:ABC transporter ATP-binding protein [uncultured Methylobacterium sp.]
MESDPILLTWRAARRQHILALGLALGLGIPLCALALLCLRDLVATLPRDEATALPFLRLVVPLQDPRPDLVLAPGWVLRPAALELAAFLCLAASALALAGLGWVVARLCVTAQNRAMSALRETVIDAILGSPAGARDEARSLADLMGRAVSKLDGPLGVGIVLPALAAAGTLLALAFAALAAPRLVPIAALGLFAVGLAEALILDRMTKRRELRGNAGEAAGRTLADLVRRMPAVRAHGSTALERARIAATSSAKRNALARAEARLAYARAPAIALAVLLPALAVGTALWRGSGPGTPPAQAVDPAALIAASAAFALAAVLLAATSRLLSVRNAIAPIFQAIARNAAALRGRSRANAVPAPLPRAGDLIARGVGAFDAATGERLAGVDARLAMPGHVAITGGRGSGARVLAAVLAGQVEPTAGAVTYGGHDLRSFDPAERARRIAYAAGEAILVEGPLRKNLLYGAASPPGDADLVDLLRLVGLDTLVYARGLTGRIDPAAEPDLARAVVAARVRMRDALRAERAERLVEPFDPALYNHQADLGANILFGEPVGPAFARPRLARHPYLRAVLEAEGLIRPLTEIGLAVARNSVEIFSDLPNDHPLFDAFSLFPASERGYFEDLVVRQADATLRRGPDGQRDRERLIGLALRYSEMRHRFGLIDAALEERIVAARHSFARMLPPPLRGAVEFYDPDRVNPAASLEENLLFGRISAGEAGAEARVRALVRRVLAEAGLEGQVYRLGLDSRVEPGAAAGLTEGALGPRERIAIDLVRCLVRRPDILVVAILLDERKPENFRERLAALRAARADRGLIVCLPDAVEPAELPPFDAVIHVAGNALVDA